MDKVQGVDLGVDAEKYKGNEVEWAAHLCIFAPDHLASWCDQAQLADIDLQLRMEAGELGGDCGAGHQ